MNAMTQEAENCDPTRARRRAWRQRVALACLAFACCGLEPRRSDGAIIVNLAIDTSASTVAAEGLVEIDTTLGRFPDSGLVEQFPGSLTLSPVGTLTVALDLAAGSYALSSSELSFLEFASAAPGGGPAQMAGVANQLSFARLGNAAMRDATFALEGFGDLVSAAPNAFSFAADEVAAAASAGTIDFRAVNRELGTTALDASFDMAGETYANQTDQSAQLASFSPFVLQLPIDFTVVANHPASPELAPITSYITTVHLTGTLVARQVGETAESQVVPEPSTLMSFGGLALCAMLASRRRTRRSQPRARAAVGPNAGGTEPDSAAGSRAVGCWLVAPLAAILGCSMAASASGAIIVVGTAHHAVSEVAVVGQPLRRTEDGGVNTSAESSLLFVGPSVGIGVEARTAARSSTASQLAVNALFSGSGAGVDKVISDAQLFVTLENLLPEPQEIVLDFLLPRGELELTDNLERFTVGGDLAASIRAKITGSNASQPLFEYSASLEGSLLGGVALTTAAQSVNPSLDLSPLTSGVVQPQNGPFDFVQSFLYEYDTFAGSVSLGVVKPGGRVHFNYDLVASVAGPAQIESGALAAINDPLSVRSAFDIRSTPVPSANVVPEPSGLAIWGLLGLISGAAGRRQTKGRGTT